MAATWQDWWNSPDNAANGFTVLVDGVDISEHVQKVHIVDEAMAADRITIYLISVHDPEAVFGQPYRGGLRRNAEAEVQLWNAAGNTFLLKKGVIPRVGWTGGADRLPLNVVTAFDKSRELMRSQKFASFRHKKDTYIVEEVAAGYGLHVSFGRNGREAIEGSSTDDGSFDAFNSRQQSAENDWALLQRMAQQKGCRLWVNYEPFDIPSEEVRKGWTLHFHPAEMQIYPPPYLSGWPNTFRYNDGHFIEARVDLNEMQKHSDLKLVSFDWTLGQAVEHEAPGIRTADGIRVLIDDKLQSFEEWQHRMAGGVQQAEKATYIVCRGAFPFGTPILRNYVYYLDGLRGQYGYDFSGLYHFNRIEYLIGEQMELRWEAYMALAHDRELYQ